MAKYFTLSSPLSRCPYTFFSEDGGYLSLFLSSLFKQHVTFSKTTRCFQQNDTMFSIKWHDVFSKTTRCFQQNDTLFSTKRHVVFFTESCIAARRFCHSLLTATQSFFPLSQFCFLRVQTFLKKLLLTRAYAHASQEFLHFCCHKCHKFSINYYVSTRCVKYRHFLTIKTYRGWKFGTKSHRQKPFLSEI